MTLCGVASLGLRAEVLGRRFTGEGLRAKVFKAKVYGQIVRLQHYDLPVTKGASLNLFIR